MLAREPETLASTMREPLETRKGQVRDSSVLGRSNYRAGCALLQDLYTPYPSLPLLVSSANCQAPDNTGDWELDIDDITPLLDCGSGNSDVSSDSDCALISDDDYSESIHARESPQVPGKKHSSSEQRISLPLAAHWNVNPGHYHHGDKSDAHDEVEIDKATKQKVDLGKDDEGQEKEGEEQTGRNKEKQDDRDENVHHEQHGKEQETMEVRQAPKEDRRASEKEAIRGQGRDVPAPDQVGAFKCIKIACSGSCSKHCPTPNLVNPAAQDRLFDAWTQVESTLAKTGQEYLSRHLDELIDLSASTGYHHRSGRARMGSCRNATRRSRSFDDSVPIPVPSAYAVAGWKASAQHQEKGAQHLHLQQLKHKLAQGRQRAQRFLAQDPPMHAWRL